MKRTFLLFSMLFPGLIALSQVIVNVQVLPPYSTYLPDYFNYANRMVITLISINGQADIKLSATVSGDNGITISTSNQFQPPAPIHLNQNEIKVLTGNDLQNYLDYNDVTVTGINKDALFHGNGIPEGIYTLCVLALDYQTGVPLSDPAPAGCSNPFDVKYVDPPVLISPQCGDSVPVANQQNIVFTWVPSQETPVTTQYKFKMVEIIPPGRNPDDVMNSATTPAFFETTVNTLVLFYGPSAPFLQPGHSYAWRVTALDGSTVNIAPGSTPVHFNNNGNSEVCWFNGAGDNPPNQQVNCDCKCKPIIYPAIKQGNIWKYVVGGTFSCNGYCGKPPEVTLCEQNKLSFTQEVTSGGDVAVIDPSTGKDTIVVKILKKGKFAIAVHVKLKCSCAECKMDASIEETVPEDPPTGCLCTIESTLVGGPPIKVEHPLSVYVKPRKTVSDEKESKNQTLAVGMSVLATDRDDLIHRCILENVWEKLIKDIGDPVSYTWTIEEGKGGKLLGADQGSAMLVLPVDLKPKEERKFRIKCRLTSAGDDELTGFVNVFVTGSDTCDYLSVRTEIEKIGEGKPKSVTLKQPGKCEPDDAATWIKGDPIAAKLTIPTYVPVGELTLIKIEASDPDRLTIKCTSDRCGKPQKTLQIFEGLKFKWDDGDAGGSFQPSADGNGVLYLAPMKEGMVTITCNINDMGNHHDASGEKTSISGNINVVDVLQAVNMGEEPEAEKPQFLTVGIDSKIRPVFIKIPDIELIRSDWCLDLGGENGLMKASAKATKVALKKENLVLRIMESAEKDHDLFLHWRNHHHIHATHPITCKFTYRFPGNDIPYIDGDWKKSNFLKETALDSFKLFFNLYKSDLAVTKEVETDYVGHMDDGTWRSEKAQKDDIYGVPGKFGEKSTDVANWFLHWAGETYNPCNHGYHLKNENPVFIYQKSFTDKNGGSPNAEYRWYKGDSNRVYVSDKALAHYTSKGMDISPILVTSNMIPAVGKVFLPMIDIYGLESAIKCINHELAHWEAIAYNWRPGGDWQSKYGNHMVVNSWATVNKGIKVDLKNVDYSNVRKYFNDARGNPDPCSFKSKPGSDVTIEWIKLTEAEPRVGAKATYKMTITCKKVINTTNGEDIDEVVLTLPGAWFVDGDIIGKNQFKPMSTIYSQNIPGISLKLTKNDKSKAKIDEYTSPGIIQNGVVIIRKNNEFWIYERHNDPDGDWIPNLVEDEMGTDWLLGRTYNNKLYHENPNDQEFWAEWRTRDLIDPKTGKLDTKECDKERDWANPGLQTVPVKK